MMDFGRSQIPKKNALTQSSSEYKLKVNPNLKTSGVELPLRGYRLVDYQQKLLDQLSLSPSSSLTVKFKNIENLFSRIAILVLDLIML